jgi:hypothetical protein
MMGAVNDFLVTYLDSIDERLLEYLDDDDELKLDAVQRLSFYTTALLEGSVTPEHIEEDWPDWYQLGPAFVAAYGSEELHELESGAEFLRAIEEDDDVCFTEADRAYLNMLEEWLGMYPEMRATDQPNALRGHAKESTDQPQDSTVREPSFGVPRVPGSAAVHVRYSGVRLR